jgi:hypothetical protein
MRLGRFRRVAGVGGVVALAGLLSGAGSERLAAPGQPPHTVQLSQMMEELSARPGFTEAMLAELDKGGKKGPALMTPALIDDLRKRIVGKDWRGLERFPGWTMKEINPTVRVVGHVVGKSAKAEDMSAVHPGASAAAAQAHALVDVGPYGLDKGGVISLGRAPEASDFPGFSSDGIVSDLGRGGGPSGFRCCRIRTICLRTRLGWRTSRWCSRVRRRT